MGKRDVGRIQHANSIEFVGLFFGRHSQRFLAKKKQKSSRCYINFLPINAIGEKCRGSISSVTCFLQYLNAAPAIVLLMAPGKIRKAKNATFGAEDIGDE